MRSARATYVPRSEAVLEAEVSTLANVYRFILDRHAKQRGRIPDKSGPDDETTVKEDSANEHRST